MSIRRFLKWLFAAIIFIGGVTILTVSVALTRVDLLFTAPLAFSLGSGDWHVEKTISEKHIAVGMDFNAAVARLRKQSFNPTEPHHSGRYFMFDVESDEQLFEASYSMVFCNVTVGVSLTENNGKVSSVRGFSPGGSCV